MELSIGKAWEETGAFLAREARLVAPVALALFALPSIVLNWAYPAGETGAAGGGAMLALLALFIAIVIGQMTVALLAIGWRGSIGQAIGKVTRRLPAFLGAALITFGPVMLLLLIVLAMLLAGAGIKDPATLTPEALAKIPGVGWAMFAMLLVLLFLSVRLFPLSAVVANETAGPIGLIKRSWALTKGHFGRLLAVLLLLLVAALVLSSAVAIVVGSIVTLVLGEPRPFNLAALLIALGGGIVGALISSVYSAMIGRIYVQLSGDGAV